MDKLRKFPINLGHLWCMIVIAGIFVFVNTHPIRPQDFWWHITVGKEIFETHVIPSVDMYSYTMYGKPYLSYHMFWLMEVFLYTIYDFGGPALIVFIQSFLVTSAYTLILIICYTLTKSWRVAALGAIYAAALGMNDWNVRPQSVTFLLGALMLWGIYSYRRKPDWKYIIPLPLAMIIWVNSHGTFPIGLTLIAIWIFDELWKSFRNSKPKGFDFETLKIPVSAFTISILAILVNPRGVGVINYLNTMRGNQSVQNLVIEWAPPAINSFAGGLFYFALLLISIVWAISPKKPDIFQIFSYLIFAILGISTSRGIIWFGLVMAPVCAIHVSNLIKTLTLNSVSKRTKESNLFNAVILVFILFTVTITLPWFKDKLPLPQTKAGLISYETPIKATEILLKEGFPNQVFHTMSYGSYLIWAAQPKYKVFVDSRIELYPKAIWQDYLYISNAQEDWEGKLAYYEINTLMLNSDEQSALVREAGESENWSQVYKDEAVILFRLNDVD